MKLNQVVNCTSLVHIVLELIQRGMEECLNIKQFFVVFDKCFEISSDIDTICTVPRHIDRESFFSEEVDGFVYRLRNIPDITHVLPIPEAMVPIIEVVWNGIELDVLFARIERSAVPELTQILDDSILKGLDRRTTMAINGPRVTELIIKLGKQTLQTSQTFLKTMFFYIF